MVDRASFQLYPDISGEDAEDTELLRGMAEEARRFITAHEWCPPIRKFHLAYGVGGVIALFLVEFAQKIPGSPDDTLWLVVGDLPSAYFVAELATTPRAALETYCMLMDDWVAAVLDERNLDEAYPVDAEANSDNARELQSRVDFLRAELITSLSARGAVAPVQ